MAAGGGAGRRCLPWLSLGPRLSQSEPDETSEERTCNRTDAAGLAGAGLVLILAAGGNLEDDGEEQVVGGECFSWQFE